MREKYTAIFMEIFSIDRQRAEKAKIRETAEWDSVGHMSLISALEDAFHIELSPDDIMNLNSYDEGIRILKRYGVEI